MRDIDIEVIFIGECGRAVEEVCVKKLYSFLLAGQPT
jgi:hypothetical protein